MSEVIFKYTLKPGVTTVETYLGATPLSAAIQDQGGQLCDLCIWVKVNPKRPCDKLRFLVVFSGQIIDHVLAGESDVGELTFINSVHSEGLMWHVFKIEYDDQTV